MKKELISGMLAAALSIACATVAIAGTDTAKEIKEPTVTKSDFKKPAWLTEFSITVKQGYDSNVYLIDHSTNPEFPANKGSWFLSFNPKVAINVLPIIGWDKDDSALQTLALSYSPDVVEYYNAGSESYTKHQFGTQIKGKVDDYSYGIDNSFTYINGDTQSNTYTPAGEISAYGTAGSRERKEQFQERLKVFARYDFAENFFVRPTASLLLYDLHTDERPSAGGYQNYPDRYDINGGVDLGYKITKDFSTYIGYRHGHQFQGINGTAASFTNRSDYERALIGIEGKPYSWLSVDLQGGPEYRYYEKDYTNNGTSGYRSGFDTYDKTTYYLSGSISAKVTSNDTIVIKTNQWQWVSSTGNTTYFDRMVEGSYIRKITSDLTGTIGFRFLESDYDSPGNRDDMVFGYFAGLNYKIDDHWSAMVDYIYGRDENDYDSTSASREYIDQVVTLGIKWTL